MTSAAVEVPFRRGDTLRLGNTSYLIVRATPQVLELKGPRGGISFLRRDEGRRDMWLHIPDTVRKAKTAWYRLTNQGMEAI